MIIFSFSLQCHQCQLTSISHAINRAPAVGKDNFIMRDGCSGGCEVELCEGVIAFLAVVSGTA